MFFSCVNDSQQVRDFLADKNLPIGVAKNMAHVYKDSGMITSKLEASLVHDFSNRKEHPYNEFPEGVLIVNFQNKGKDSVTIVGDYALSYAKTSISEIVGNVQVINYAEQSILETDQLYWDEKEGYFFSESPFVLTTKKDTIRGVGFESNENLTKWLAKETIGNLETTDE